MSWIFMHIRHPKKYHRSNIDLVHPNASFHCDSPDFYLAAGGNKNTLMTGEYNSKNKGFIVCGLGINQNQSAFLSAKNWNDILSYKIDVNNIDGHFVIIKWDEETIEVVTDVLGLRDLYLYKSEDEIVLSTNVFWLKPFLNLELDFHVVGSRWLLFNQISNESIFLNVHRISSGQQLMINQANLSIKYKKIEFLPDIDIQFDMEKIINRMFILTQFPIKNNRKLSLSLSGGMDSRVLLSFLMQSDLSGWETHTFGAKSHPDGCVVDRIVHDFHLEHMFIDLPLPEKDTLIENLKQFVQFSLVSNPASEIVQLNNYTYFSEKDSVLIDGGFAEIWRREYLNKLAFHQMHPMKSLNPESMIKYLMYSKATLFSNEVMQLQYTGCVDQLENTLSTFPDYKIVGLGNWLDLFTIKSRFVNVFGHEQTRLDQAHTCYMPLAQQSLLKWLFSMPVDQRKNAKLYRNIIKNNQKKLTKYPLAKGSGIYPFHFTSMQSRIWSMVMKKIGKAYSNPNQHDFLSCLSDFILDTIQSRDVREYPYYDYKHIKRLGDVFYHDDSKIENELDWFLSFEMLRQLMQ